ncbi:MAG: glycosyltransferase, partial [Brevinema sp.]
GARNTGIQNANAEYITFLDSDDFVDHDTYEKTLASMSFHKVNLGIFSTIDFKDKSKESWVDPYFIIKERNPFVIDAGNASSISVTAWNKIFRTSDLVTHTITFPEHLKHEDEEFWYKYIAKIQPTAVFQDDVCVHYRHREGSIMSSSQATKLDMLDVLLNISLFLEKENLLSTSKRSLYLILSRIPEWYENEFQEESKKVFVKKVPRIIDILKLSFDECYDINRELVGFYPNSNKITEFIEKLIEKREDKWYKFGQLSTKEKVQKIFSVLFKKILPK